MTSDARPRAKCSAETVHFKQYGARASKNINERLMRWKVFGDIFHYSGFPAKPADVGLMGSKGLKILSLHALRVSLITAYALEGGVPFPVISKLIAGHSRIIMTLYYTKAGKAHVTEVMAEAERKMLSSEAASHKRFSWKRPTRRSNSASPL